MPKKWINLILSSVVFIVWLFIFFKYFVESNQPEITKDFTTPHVNFTSQFHKANYDSSTKRDPFLNPFNKPSKKQPVAKKRKAQKVIRHLNIKLLGLLTDEKGKLAIIEFENGESHFMRIGDIKEEIKLLKILDNEVEVLFENRSSRIGF